MIKIAHLYYDLMNLYGENGNVKALISHFENQGHKCEIHFLTASDDIDFEKYDIYYLGSGSEESQVIALNDLMKYKEKIKMAIKNGTYFIATGNSYELFGKYIEKLNGKKISCLDIFDYYAREIDFRISEEQIYSCSIIPQKIIGFTNRSSILKNDKNHLFEVITGTGYEPNSKEEGYFENNFFGTYLIGPLLIRNPYLTDHIIKNICKNKNINYKENTSIIDYKAYEIFVNETK